MQGIGGNATATIQALSVTENALGEPVKSWDDALELRGWLDLMSGDSPNSNMGTKLQESTHVFVADWADLSAFEPQGCRLRCGGRTYDVLYIDDPMGMHLQVEIYLKYLGGDA